MRRRFTLLVLALLAMGSGLAGPAAPAWAVPPDDDDGRSGDRDGDYIVYCRDGFIQVWRLKENSTKGELVAMYRLGELDNLHRQGDSFFEASSGVTVTRWGDRIEVSGWGNGNHRFARNSRVIQVGDCFGLGPGYRDPRDKKIQTLIWDAKGTLAGNATWQLTGLAFFREIIGALVEELDEMARTEPNDALRATLASLADRLSERLNLLEENVGLLMEAGQVPIVGLPLPRAEAGPARR